MTKDQDETVYIVKDWFEEKNVNTKNEGRHPCCCAESGESPQAAPASAEEDAEKLMREIGWM